MLASASDESVYIESHRRFLTRCLSPSNQEQPLVSNEDATDLPVNTASLIVEGTYDSKNALPVLFDVFGVSECWTFGTRLLPIIAIWAITP